MFLYGHLWSELFKYWKTSSCIFTYSVLRIISRITSSCSLKCQVRGLIISMFNLFGKTHTPEETKERDRATVRAWQQELRKDMRKIDRDVSRIQNSELKTQKEIKQLAKKGEIKSVKILAKEIVHSRKVRDRLLTSKAQMNSVIMSLESCLASIKMGESIGQAAGVMENVNQVT
jgi:hypothetical protein